MRFAPLAPLALALALALASGHSLAQAGPSPGRGNSTDHSGSPTPGYSFGAAQVPADPARPALQSRGRQDGASFCLPSYSDYRGALTLETPGNPQTCIFRSEVKVRNCDCSTYRYKDVHTVTPRPNFQVQNYEESQDGTSCVSYSYAESTSCDKFGCTTSYTPYCPQGGMM